MLISLSVLFWMILDPIGMVPIFAATVSSLSPERQKIVIIREMFIALGIMILTLFFGEKFFQLLDVDENALAVAGGAILGIIGIQMIFAGPQENLSPEKKRPEPLVVPLAIPIMAGPGILTTIILYSGKTVSNVIVLFAILIAWGCSLPIILVAPQIKKYIGVNGSIAVERIFGYILILIAVQILFRGIVQSF